MALNEGGRGGTMGRGGRIVRNALVVAEVALAVVVLIGAGLLIRSFIRSALHRSRVSSPPGVLTMRVPLAGGANASCRSGAWHSCSQLCDTVSQRCPACAAWPSLNGLPLTGLIAGAPFWVEGIPRSARFAAPHGADRDR